MKSVFSKIQLRILVGWVEGRNPTLLMIVLGFAIAQPNLRTKTSPQ